MAYIFHLQFNTVGAAQKEQSDLTVYCLLRLLFLYNIHSKYSISFSSSSNIYESFVYMCVCKKDEEMSAFCVKLQERLWICFIAYCVLICRSWHECSICNWSSL